MTTKIKTVFGLAGGLAIATALAVAPRAAWAIPAYPSGSIAFGSVVANFTNADHGSQIDASTTQIVINQPGFTLGPSTGNLEIPSFTQVPMGPSVGGNVAIAIPTRVTTLLTPLTVSVEGFSFAFNTEELNGRATGNIGLKFTGHLTGSPTGFTPLANQDADLSITFTESAPGGAIGAAYSLDTPATFHVDVPEPASMALLGSSLFGLGMIRHRKLRRTPPAQP